MGMPWNNGLTELSPTGCAMSARVAATTGHAAEALAIEFFDDDHYPRHRRGR